MILLRSSINWYSFFFYLFTVLFSFFKIELWLVYNIVLKHISLFSVVKQEDTFLKAF